MPWIPELFSAPILEHIEEHRDTRVTGVPFFDGLRTGEIGALIGSFAGEPVVLHPTRGRIEGAAAFSRYVSDTNAWLAERDVTVDDVSFIVTPRRGVEEFVLRVDGDTGGIELPVGLAADLDADGRMIELRLYVGARPPGGLAVRPPLLLPDPDLRLPDVVGDHQRALAAGDVDAVVATFEPDGQVREPAGGASIHRGADELRALYSGLFSNGGGIVLEPCAVTDDGRTCALEHNVAAWGRTALPPGAGIAVYVRGDNGRLAAARVYNDVDPPLGRPSATPRASHRPDALVEPWSGL